MRFRKYHTKRINYTACIAIILTVLMVFTLYKIDHDMKPFVIALCDAEARIVATETINGTISDEFGSKISYDDIMNVKTDKEGNVVMIQANTVELNRMGSQLALSVQKRVTDLGVKTVQVPLGVLFKNNLFAYYGPKINFKMEPIGSIATNFRSDFKAAGINQTRQIIYLDITANIQVVIPLARNTVTVTSSVPVAESIIVGKVPDTYANFENGTGNDTFKVYGIPKSK